ncbi:1246_t:CDS:2, partial [Dentiscutata erythropus]
ESTFVSTKSMTFAFTNYMNESMFTNYVREDTFTNCMENTFTNNTENTFTNNTENTFTYNTENTFTHHTWNTPISYPRDIFPSYMNNTFTNNIIQMNASNLTVDKGDKMCKGSGVDKVMEVDDGTEVDNSTEVDDSTEVDKSAEVDNGIEIGCTKSDVDSYEAIQDTANFDNHTNDETSCEGFEVQQFEVDTFVNVSTVDEIKRFLCPGWETVDKDSIRQLANTDEYLVPSTKKESGFIYNVNSAIGTCNCFIGMSGAPCKHQGLNVKDHSFYASLRTKPTLINQHNPINSNENDDSNAITIAKSRIGANNEFSNIKDQEAYFDDSSFNNFLTESKVGTSNEF